MDSELVPVLVVAAAAVLTVIAWLRRGRAPPRSPLADVGFPLGPNDVMEERHFFSHVLITGQSGSGKSSGPLEQIIRFLMRRGWGLLILTVKPDEADKMLALAREEGREADFIRFSPSSGLAYDFLAYELSQPGGSPQSAARLLALAVEINSRQSGKGGDESFWQMLGERIMLIAITTVWLALGTCSVRDVHQFVVSLPGSHEQLQDPAWKASFCSRMLLLAAERKPGADLDLCCDFVSEWIGLSEKTRSVAYTLVVNVTSQFLIGPISHMVAAGKIDVSPDDALRGKIVCLDAPILVHGAGATFLQCIFKAQLQQAAQRRDLCRNPTPCGIVSDEAHYTLTPSTELLALTTCRSAKLAHIYATQGLPACYAQLGGTEKARHETDGIIGQFLTKIITCNGCGTTNRYMQDMIGGDFRALLNGHAAQEPWNPIDQFLGRQQDSTGFSLQYLPLVPEGEMSRLTCGGVENGRRVAAIVFQSGHRFSSGRTFLRTVFHQTGG